PDRIVSSPATRARTTASLANESGAWKRTIAHEASLYLASGPTMVEVLRQQPADATRTLIVGHEPGCSALIAGLVGGARVRFPTAALARIDFEVDAWSSVQPDAGALQWLVVPRLLAAYAAALGG
ncbi:MAG: histidine phosphatase family protein, partial [Planctomycetota bacterium]